MQDQDAYDQQPETAGFKIWNWRLVVLPLVYVVVALALRSGAGPFWQWNLLDPSYFYLLDALNLLTGSPPGHLAHPGITVDVFGAVAIWLSHLGDDIATIKAAVLARPEVYLHILSTAYIALVAMILWGVGVAAFRVFGAVLPAAVCQSAPFVSTIVLKHAILPKPEAMLVAATMAMIAAVIMTLRVDHGQKSGSRHAIVFGIIAGFAMATKITAIPLFVLPLFLLPTVASLAVFAIVAGVSFLVFFLPGIGAAGLFFDWVRDVLVTAGAHTSGPATVINVEEYPKAVLKILKRPSLKVPLAIAVVTVGLVIWRRRQGVPFAAPEFRALWGISAAQAVHVLVVAKQPTAFYMIPSYMLSAVSVLLAARLLWQCRPRTWRLPVSASVIGGALFAIFAASQAAGMIRLDQHFRQLHADAAVLPPARFSACARVYIYAASTPVYAMYLANMVTGARFTEDLKLRFSGNDYWIDDWYDPSKRVLRNWDGVQDFSLLRARYPCFYLRGNRPGGLTQFLQATAPGLKFSTQCRAGIETVLTVNVDCEGNVTR